MDTEPTRITTDALSAAILEASDGDVVSLKAALAALRALCPHVIETDAELCEILLIAAPQEGRAVLLDLRD
ncbi:hypothetical protein NKJ70_19825 [Mesorhizobium sp. M0092]|uniref:hypothetical protein n=1 Tax=unclassified Mesorhizobium TaxID=325217 RepID=UPI00333E092F